MVVDIRGVLFDWKSADGHFLAQTGGQTWTPSSFAFPNNYFIRPFHPIEKQAFPVYEITTQRGDIITMNVDTMTSTGAITSQVRGKLNDANPWNNSATSFSTSYTDNVFVLTHDNASGNNEEFFLVDDQTLRTAAFRNNWTLLYGGVDYDPNNLFSVNSLFGNTITKKHPQNGFFYSNSVSQMMGHLSPAHESCLYLHSPQLSGMGTKGPKASSASCIASLPLTGVYGDVLYWSPHRSHRLLVPPPSAITHIDVALRTSQNQEVDMRGSALSFTVSIVDI